MYWFGCIGKGAYRGLITISLDLHSSGNTSDGFLSGKISDVNESIVEANPSIHQSISIHDLFGY
jgi:hypothetical protein